VPPELIAEHGETMMWSRMSGNILWTIDVIRELYGEAVFVNHPNYGTPYRGLRPWNYNDGSDISPHKCGIAIDFNFAQTTHAKFLNDVLTKRDQPEFQFITGIEDFPGITWNHIDNRNWPFINGKPLVFGKT